MISEILAIAATVAGLVMSSASLIQAHKMYKRKSSADVSILMFIIFLSGACIWLSYGLSIMNIPLIVANAMGIISNVIASALWFKYNKLPLS